MQIRARSGVSLVAVLAFACELGEVHEADRHLNEEVDLAGASALVLDVPVPVEIVGLAATTSLTMTGTLTVATSSAPRSRRLAEELAVEHRTEGGRWTVVLSVPGDGAGTPFPEATLRGTLDVRLPDELPLTVLQRGGSVTVDAMQTDLDVRSAGPVRVTDAPASVSVRCDNGPVEIATRAAPGTRTFLGMVQGREARVVLPATLNARVVAQTEDGQIFLGHPQLSPGPAEPYDTVAGSALAEVEVSVGRGNIVLTAR